MASSKESRRDKDRGGLWSHVFSVAQVGLVLGLFMVLVGAGVSEDRIANAGWSVIIVAAILWFVAREVLARDSE